MKSSFFVKVLLAAWVVAWFGIANAGMKPAFWAEGKVYRVIDGDTYIVNLSKKSDFDRLVGLAGGDQKRTRYLDSKFKSMRVRLANVDTPESVHPDASKNTQRGKTISWSVKQALEGKSVVVRCFDWGKHGRAICNVQRSYGRTNEPIEKGDMGLWLMRAGYSDYVTKYGRNPWLDKQYRKFEK